MVPTILNTSPFLNISAYSFKVSSLNSCEYYFKVICFNLVVCHSRFCICVLEFDSITLPKTNSILNPFQHLLQSKSTPGILSYRPVEEY